MSKSGTFPQAVHDFRVSNGSDTVYHTEGPSLTRQEFADECDINKLMQRYEGHVIGGPGNMAPAQPIYADFGEMPSTLMEYMTFMENAQSAFMSLPAVVRKEFDNSAALFVDFASDPENLDQMRTWGLAPPAKAPEALAVDNAGPGAGAPEGSPAPSGGSSTHGST